MNADLEILREIFRDKRLHFGIGTVMELGLSNDKSVLRVKVNIIPDEREAVAEMTFSDCNSVTFPEINDLVLVAFVDGDPDECFVVKTINTADEPIPAFATTGNTVVAPREGQLIGLTRAAVIPTEPMVLGNQLVAYLAALEGHLATLITLTETFALAAQTFAGSNVDPGSAFNAACTVYKNAIDIIKTSLSTDKTQYLDTAGTNILSQLVLTERGV